MQPLIVCPEPTRLGISHRFCDALPRASWLHRRRMHALLTREDPLSLGYLAYTLHGESLGLKQITTFQHRAKKRLWSMAAFRVSLILSLLSCGLMARQARKTHFMKTSRYVNNISSWS